MPTLPSGNRPFFANFLSAFRAHSALSKASTASSGTPTSTSQFASQPSGASARSVTTSHTTTTSTSTPKSPSATTPHTQPTASSNPTSSTATTMSPARQPSSAHHHSHISRAATAAAAARQVSTSPPLSTPSSGWRMEPQRRGSDSSSDGGFRETLGAEKWYVGGRTAAGEERFYRLGMVRKERSGDRLSLDRLSL